MAFIAAYPVLTAIIASTAISATAAVANANSQSNAQRYNSQIAQRDATIATDQGNAQAGIQSRAARTQLDAARAQYGASGVDANAGSPLDVLQAGAMNASLDNQTIKYNAQTRAYGFGNEATSYNYQANAATTRGMFAGSDILSGGLARAYGARGYTPNGPGTAINMNAE